jgi:pectate lyase
MLVGSTDTEFASIGNMKVTYHHNWFEGTVQRNPRIRFGEVHVFNNYYDGVTGYGMVSVQFADLVAQGNYFAIANNHPAVSTGGVAESPHKGDAVVCDNFSEPNGGTLETRGNAFDPGAFYSYHLESPADAHTSVMNFAGVQ